MNRTEQIRTYLREYENEKAHIKVRMTYYLLKSELKGRLERESEIINLIFKHYGGNYANLVNSIKGRPKLDYRNYGASCLDVNE